MATNYMWMLPEHVESGDSRCYAEKNISKGDKLRTHALYGIVREVFSVIWKNRRRRPCVNLGKGNSRQKEKEIQSTYVGDSLVCWRMGEVTIVTRSIG